ncbi:MAG TPA: NAD(P)-binding domain-containing protein [Polyangiaceae bacterium]|nr:NAD(P)-binding domain-containing protein [Polyangiaceae bacterium]
MNTNIQAVSGIDGLIEEGAAFAEANVAPLKSASQRKRYDVVVIGGGQAGLSVGYQLKKLGLNFLILEASARVGDVWRRRWDTLRLFTSARYDGLDGMPFPGPPGAFPGKDQMGDYLESYAAHFQLPVQTGVWVQRLWREGRRYFVDAGEQRFEAEHVVIAMASFQGRKVPSFAKQLLPHIVQLHSSEYKSLAQLKPGAVLVVGAGNSGGEIAIEAATQHPTWISGRDPGQIPFPTEKPWVQAIIMRFVFKFLFHHIFTSNTPIGRKVRSKLLHSGGPRIRQRRSTLKRAGVQWVPRTSGVKDGLPRLEDGRTLDVQNIIWCTGYERGLSWIDLPIFEPNGDPRQQSGLVENEPGLYFVGQHFQHSLSSTMIFGVSRDAARVVAAIKSRRQSMVVLPMIPHLGSS